MGQPLVSPVARRATLPETDERIAHFAAAQSVAEIGLGSAVHALRIPLGGHLLSLNQGLLLTLALRKISGRRRGIASANAIALVASAMKSLSPAGQKLAPMLAIAVQGVLFSLGITFFGMNFVGAAFGMVLLSVWGFVQPLLFASLLFGGDFFRAVEEAWRGLAEILEIPFEFGVAVLIAAVVAKSAIAASIGVFGWRSGVAFERVYFGRIARIRERFRGSKPPSRDANLDPAAGALFDLMNPWFLASFALTLAFIVYAGNESRRWIYFGRTLVASYLLFYAVRVLPPVLGPRLRGKFPRLEKVFAQALAESRSAARDRSRS
jgi:hypothetical protein